ncbi:hypothetical protein EDF56_11624 [Novosphingobium sp. PhB165]|nr:hypothetical protein EDF56_11624 [Novosphingobium sp. PhB165]
MTTTPSGEAIVEIPQDAPRRVNLLGLDKITLAALGAGVVNLVGGATAVRAWLYDLGLRYYDQFGVIFGLPEGSFDLSSARLISKGWEIVLDSSQSNALYAFLIPPVALYVALFYGFAGFVSEKFSSRPERVRDFFRVERRIGIMAVIAVLFLLTAGLSWALRLAIYELPSAAKMAGQNDAWVKRTEVRDATCIQCNYYGHDAVKGVALVSNGKFIFVAKRTGGVAQIPLEGFSSRFLQPLAIEPDKSAAKK